MSHCNSLLIAGCGDVGTRLGLRMAEQGWRVLGMRRNVAALPTAIEPLAGDLHADACPADWPQGPLDYLVYCAAATQHDEAGYRAALRVFSRISENQARWRINSIEVLWNGFGQGREAVFRAIMASEGEQVRNMIKVMTDKTPIKIGGVRPKKRRML